ncbi:probable RNA-binding protein 23, partial [Nyctibius grandis]|uniref:probable RNA-binding protein 23 n=1 Tax=Nyctibius grandis TaxID=48427 RepID=UPI0035BBF427
MEAGGSNPLQDPTDAMTSDDFDIVIEAMLEAPYKKEEAQPGPSKVQTEPPAAQQPAEETSKEAKKESGSSGGSSSRKKRSRSRSREHRHSRSRDRDRERRRRSRSRERRSRHRSRSRERRRGSRSRSRERRRDERARRRFGHSKSPLYREKSPAREPLGSLSPEERDARTVFCMQLAARIRPRDLEDFFSSVGK